MGLLRDHTKVGVDSGQFHTCSFGAAARLQTPAGHSGCGGEWAGLDPREHQPDSLKTDGRSGNHAGRSGAYLPWDAEELLR